MTKAKRIKTSQHKRSAKTATIALLALLSPTLSQAGIFASIGAGWAPPNAASIRMSNPVPVIITPPRTIPPMPTYTPYQGAITGTGSWASDMGAISYNHFNERSNIIQHDIAVSMWATSNQLDIAQKSSVMSNLSMQTALLTSQADHNWVAAAQGMVNSSMTANQHAGVSLNSLIPSSPAGGDFELGGADDVFGGTGSAAGASTNSAYTAPISDTNNGSAFGGFGLSGITNYGGSDFGGGSSYASLPAGANVFGTEGMGGAGSMGSFSTNVNPGTMTPSYTQHMNLNTGINYPMTNMMSGGFTPSQSWLNSTMTASNAEIIGAPEAVGSHGSVYQADLIDAEVGATIGAADGSNPYAARIEIDAADFTPTLNTTDVASLVPAPSAVQAFDFNNTHEAIDQRGNAANQDMFAAMMQPSQASVDAGNKDIFNAMQTATRNEPTAIGQALEPWLPGINARISQFGVDPLAETGRAVFGLTEFLTSGNMSLTGDGMEATFNGIKFGGTAFVSALAKAFGTTEAVVQSTGSAIAHGGAGRSIASISEVLQPTITELGSGMNSRVWTSGDGFVNKEVAGGLEMAKTLENQVNSIAQVFPDLVPSLTRDGTTLRQSMVDGLNIGDFDLSTRMKAIDNANELMSRADYEMGMKWVGEKLRYEESLVMENGLEMHIDRNLANFKFNADGTVKSWFDPLAVYKEGTFHAPPAADVARELNYLDVGGTGGG